MLFLMFQPCKPRGHMTNWRERFDSVTRDGRDMTPWILGALVVIATVVMMIVWLPGGPTSQTATQTSRSPIAKTPDQPPPPLKPQPH
jgi:hypothetical protein